MRIRLWVFGLVGVVLFSNLLAAQQLHVQSTAPLTPEEQLERFHLPPGFKIELFASGPQIEKPTNMAFDGQGRLWVCSTHEYPFAAKPGKGQDRIVILSDADQDGRADSANVVAENLNIPMGLYPFRNGVIAYSIPNISFISGHSDSEHSDSLKVLYGPMGNPLDTHGLQNSFRRGFDGWIYVNHGFRNDSTIEGSDGSKIVMNSGSCYRIRPDGSRVEIFTRGQVNPFGSTFLETGDLISVDCHSYPVSVLLRGGFYESFGKPHDGIGFVPKVLSHTHGPTAIAGVATLRGTSFPAEYQDSILVGNVVSGRIRRDRITYRGSTIDLHEAPSFLTCDDPWFRPVDLQVGPDGALYVADFYNSIIGHYEVPLDHPDRDRKRGRIWRITYAGDSPSPRGISILERYDLTTMALPGLIELLKDPMLGVRMLVTDQLSDRLGESVIEPLRAAMSRTDNAFVQVHGLWVLFRFNAISQRDLERAVGNSNALVRNHAMRVLAELKEWPGNESLWAIAGLDDVDALVRRSAVDALGQHPELANIDSLIECFEKTPTVDTHLRHAIRMALKRHLEMEGAFAGLQALTLSDSRLDALVGIALAVDSSASARFVMESVQRSFDDHGLLVRQIRHVAKSGESTELGKLVGLIQERFSDDEDRQIEFLELMNTQIQTDGPHRKMVIQWAENLLAKMERVAAREPVDWFGRSDANPWGLEFRNCSDGQASVAFLSSLPGGESTTGKLVSKPFPLPEKMTFFLCGHRGFPQDAAGSGNRVRLRLVESGEIVRTAFPPRNDLAQEVQWDLSPWSGAIGVLEVVDGNSLNAFAWLAVSRFQPAVVEVPELSPQVAVRRGIARARIAQTLQLKNEVPRLRAMVDSNDSDWLVQVACAEALSALESSSLTRALVSVLREPSIDFDMKAEVLAAVAREGEDSIDVLPRLMKVVPERIQEAIAIRLVSDQVGARFLLQMISKGQASGRLLQRQNIHESLVATRLENAEIEIALLTRNLPPVEAVAEKMIKDLGSRFRDSNSSPAKGRVVFKKSCVACHQVGGVGMVVGPQLDGIGHRGEARILEDILNPHQNVDGAFLSTMMLLEDGRVLSGLFRRNEGDRMVFANSEGKEFVVDPESIESQKKLRLSVMPGNFSTVLNEEDCLDLVAYLLTLDEKSDSPVTWEYTSIDTHFRSEGIAVADVNQDGKMDILAGEYWYAAPEWTPNEITEPGDYGDGAHGYSRCFECFSADVNQDGWPDQIVIGMPATPCHWYENPKGKKQTWKKHEIWESACNETPIFTDLFGNGKPVLVMAWHPGGKEENGQMIWLEPGKDPNDRWDVHPISRPGTAERPVPGTKRFSHGLGAGDVNGDKRIDVITTGGWWEQPDSVGDRPWVFHSVDLGPDCANMFVVDLNNDGRGDLVSSSAHRYGIWWHEQMPNGENSKSVFQRHDLFPELVSQTHAMQLVDIDGDGLDDLVTGKRFWAHGPKGDPGSEEPANLFWFQARKKEDGSIRFEERLIHGDSGMGTQFVVADVNGDNLPDVVTSNKKGVHLLLQHRREVIK